MTEERENLQHQADRSKPHNSHSVLIYLAVLFVAAFVLLLLAYFMQQRINQDTMEDLKETSVSAVQSMEQLSEENGALREQIKDLEAQLDSFQGQLETANRDYAQLNTEYTEYVNYTNMLDTLYAAETMIAEQNYTKAAALLADWDSVALVETIEQFDASTERQLPEEISMSSRYEELVSILTRRGYLVQADDGTLALPSEDD